GAGADTIDGGPGDDVINAGPGDGGDRYVGATSGSLVTVSGPTGTLDFSGRPENLTFIVKRNAAAGKAQVLVGWGDRLTTSSTIPGEADFQHMVWVTDAAYVDHLIGGNGADTFHVYETAGGQLLLDGGKGNDRYVFHDFNNAATINAKVSEGGDP